MDNVKELSAKDYFESVKAKKIKITDNDLLKVYENAEVLLQKAVITDQKKAAKKLMFHLDTVTKERELVKLGIDTFVYKDDIEDYIDNVSKNVVKIIELENYEREIPDEIVEVIAKTKNIFDKMYVVFTDYTGKVEKQIEEERKEKDPILFGTFQDKKSRVVVDRFYFLGDWVDEYCDLTLDKMVSEMKSVANKEIIRNISTPKSLDEIREQLALIDERNGRFIVREPKKEEKKTFFAKVRSVFSKGNK